MSVLVSALFVNRDSFGHLAEALRSLHESLAPATRSALEVIVVDNDSRSSEGRRAAERELARLGGRLEFLPENVGYGAGINRAAALAHGEFLLASNPDVLFVPGCVERLVAALEGDASLGVAAPSVFLDRTRTVRAPAHLLPTPRDLLGSTLAQLSAFWNRRHSRKRSAHALREWRTRADFDEPMFGGCCFLLRRALFETLGGFDPRFPLYFEDTDLALRVRRYGERLRRVVGAEIVHLYGRSSARDPAHAARAYATSRAHFLRGQHGIFGSAMLRLCEALLARAGPRARHARALAVLTTELAPGSRRIPLPAAAGAVLVELAADPCFLLCAGMFPGGPMLELPAEVRAREEDIWLRALDSGAEPPREIGRWALPGRRVAAGFTRLLEDAEADLCEPRASLARAELAQLVQEFTERGLALRLDAHRTWELARALAELGELAPACRPARVLDVGGGNGPLAYLLARAGQQVTMLDVDAGAVGTCQRQAAELGLLGLTAIAARPPWPFPDGSFDAVVCISVLEGILRRDRGAFFAEIRRVLAPGAPLLLTCDFGPEASFLGDAPRDLAELARDAVSASGLVLRGELPREVALTPENAPVRAQVRGADGGERTIGYTFVALRLEKPLTEAGTTASASPRRAGPPRARGPG